ncbi:efflux RND transporter periplasmic adaptor subunit [Pendulispora brunnea]|uniref:Efflux RND transporter periplasmic adaptor subunit n=1 Tax=Pendulispora brunnea TaxID=2905690 RepID=A0ABZ2KNB2_9BACT
MAPSMSACKRSEAKAEPVSKEDPVVHASVVQVTEQAMPEYLTLIGTLRANQESDIAADASGKVLATFVERGQAVRKGESLARLDSRAAVISVSATEAQSNQVKANLEQAQRECERVKHLLETSAISQAEYDRTTSQCSSTQWSLAAAEAQHENARKLLGDSNLRAPFDGVIGERYVSVGQYVKPETKVASIYAPDPLRLELTVPEAQAGMIQPDMKLTFSVTAFGDEKFSGTVRYVSPHIRESSRDLVVEAIVPNPGPKGKDGKPAGVGKLRPGMFATAKLLLSEHPVPAVPVSALKREGITARIFAVVDGRANERLVQVGEEKGGLIAVVSGINRGDGIVAEPGPDIRDGVRIQ